MLRKHKDNLEQRTRIEAIKCTGPSTATARQIMYGAKIWSTYAVPKLLHGIAAIPFNDKVFEKAEIEQRRFIRNISKLEEKTRIGVLYGETELKTLVHEAEKRAIKYLFHVQELPNSHLVKLVFEEQKEMLENNVEIETWLKNTVRICNKYNIEPFRKIKENDLKKKIDEKWLDHYKGLITGSTMKYYKNKKIPKINRGLNITNGGEYWLKAKAGALRLNNIYHTKCTRCDTNEEKTLEHFLWKCPNNVQHTIQDTNTSDPLVNVEVRQNSMVFQLH